MVGKVLQEADLLSPDRLATTIAHFFIENDMKRAGWKSSVEEVRRYVFATDTTQTSNSTLPWKNKTTLPKLCQVRDNIYSNYSLTMFPNRKPVLWEGNNADANSLRKREAISNYMTWVMEQPSFKHEIDKVILDYIDYGNCFVTVDWCDERVETPGITQTGYIGPVVRRINPMDIVFLPVAPNFRDSPKVIKSIVSLGELKDMLEKLSNDQNREEYEDLWKYLKDTRTAVTEYTGDFHERDALYKVDGFDSFQSYLASGYAEVLTFYGDIYDEANDVFLKNHVITVVDRHKLINKKPNPSFFGYPPIFHAAWRKRQDNIWGMGPLNNLVGLQYRMDHIENMKADIFDLVTFPVQKVKGFVEDFTWQPGEKIYVSEEGDVELLTPDVNVLHANIEIQNIERLMEEMAGAPKEAMGFRTPGEKTKYEVQRLENAASRVFQNKIKQFEEQILEPVLNAMLELARRNLTGATTIKVFDDELKFASFQELTAQDITGIGRIKPVASRHFAEQAELIQNLTNLTNSNLWATVAPHFSSFRIAQIIEESFNLKEYGAVLENVAITEQAEQQKFANALQEQVAQEATTATGLGEDFDLEEMNPMMEQAQ